ncbi:short-chain fatty acid transporter, partial [Rhodococcus qingshengii]|uniref:short-chain fatty acid transporter n=1 Tax=Rhodococcus qingshengii TaxID=334542 RepID=UPI00355C5514
MNTTTDSSHKDPHPATGQSKKSPIVALQRFFTVLMRSYLPDPFVLVIALTLLTAGLALGIEHASPVQIVRAWGDGFWALLAFTTQMAVILATGYVLARAPIVDRALDRLVSRIDRPQTAIITATLVGALGSYVNWGFGLVIGGIIARKLATEVRGVHFPLIIAAAYSGFTLYGLGLSASIPIAISTPDHPLSKQIGLVPLRETIFSIPMILTALAVLIILPVLNAALHPRGDAVIELDQSTPGEAEEPETVADDAEPTTFAERLNHSKFVSYSISALGFSYVAISFVDGRTLDINMVNFIVLFLGILLLRTPAAYVTTLTSGIRTVVGIILQFPFYAGIMAIMSGTGLVLTVSGWFTGIADPQSLPFLGMLSSFVINFFAPSAGGHWVIQGPFMIDEAHARGSSIPQNA